jgi:hypothetical protein
MVHLFCRIGGSPLESRNSLGGNLRQTLALRLAEDESLRKLQRRFRLTADSFGSPTFANWNQIAT